MPDEPISVLVRADASPSIGLGHVMRSLTLARSLDTAECEVRFRGSGLPAAVWTQLAATSIVLDPRDLPDTSPDDAAAVVAGQPDLVVVDGYHFDAAWFATLDAAGIAYVVIDDNAETAALRPAAVVNQNPHASPHMYRHLTGTTELLLGTEYALVRPEIRAIAAAPPDRLAGTVFVAMGGSDPSGLTGPTVAALADAGVRVQVAVGPSVAHRAETVAHLRTLAGVAVIESDNYEVSLASCAAAVLAAGTSLWEAAVLDTPTVAIVVAENQRASARSAAAHRLVDAVLEPEPDGAVPGLLDAVRRSLEPRPPSGTATSSIGAGHVELAVLRLARQHRRRPRAQ